MKNLIFVLLMTGFSVTTMAQSKSNLTCNSDISVGLKETITYLKLNSRIDQTAQGILQNIANAQTCEQVDRINLAVINYVLSTQLK